MHKNRLEPAEHPDEDPAALEKQAALELRRYQQAYWRSIWKNLPGVYEQYCEGHPDREIPYSD